MVLFTVATFVLLFAGMISCYNAKTIKQENARDLSVVLNEVREATLLVELEVDLVICIEETGDCFPEKIFSATGTGVLVHKTDSTSLIYTAGHICDMRTLPKLPPAYNTITFDYGLRFAVNDTEMQRYSKIERYYVDESSDSCILQLDEVIPYEPLKIAKDAPAYGHKYYNTGAPSGIFEKGSVIVAEGLYSGLFKTNTMYGVEMADAYSFGVTGGSSGSPVVDGDGALVGIVFSFPSDFKNVAFCVRYDVVKEFIQKTVERI